MPQFFRHIPPWLWRASLGLCVLGAAFLTLGVLGDIQEWWDDLPFLTNVVSAFTGALFGIPLAAVVLSAVSNEITKTAEVRSLTSRCEQILLRMRHPVDDLANRLFAVSVLVDACKKGGLDSVRVGDKIPEEPLGTLRSYSWVMDWPDWSLAASEWESFIESARELDRLERPIIGQEAMSAVTVPLASLRQQQPPNERALGLIPTASKLSAEDRLALLSRSAPNSAELLDGCNAWDTYLEQVIRLGEALDSISALLPSTGSPVGRRSWTDWRRCLQEGTNFRDLEHPGVSEDSGA